MIVAVIVLFAAVLGLGYCAWEFHKRFVAVMMRVVDLEEKLRKISYDIESK